MARTGTAQKQEIQLAVEGMSCASCVRRVETAIKDVPGILEASVNLATGRALVAFKPGTVALDNIESAVKKAGYGTHRIASDVDEEHEP